MTSSDKTANYGLPKWEKDDFIQMDDFNKAFSTIDETLKATADTAARKADASALASEAEARDSAIAALTKNLGANGNNCRLATGSYTGEGTYGAENARSLSFDFVPMLIFISSDTAASSIGQSFLIRPFTQAEGQDGNKLIVTWGERSVSWYTEKTISTSQNNKRDCLYHYFALGYDPADA